MVLQRLVCRRLQVIFLLGLIFNLYACSELRKNAMEPTATGPVEIIKAAVDDRQYRYLELDNELKVLLVSDPGSDKAAVSMDVFVGSRQDPEDHPGLAHFLEHMLFLGTKAYPEAGEYQEYIAAHGGEHNAYTSFEHTNYFFDISANSLAPALDRFAPFFISPLFTEKYVDRERNAVNSEYTSKLKSEQRRALDVVKALVNPEHPYAKFSVGNLQTLANDVHGSLRDQLIQFYQKNYSANQMRLVVLGTESLDELEALVRPRFAAVPNHHVEAKPITQPLYRQSDLPLEIFIAPEKDVKKLVVDFPVPDVMPYYRSKPINYISNLLGHEGKGSLLSALKARGYAEALSAGLGVSYVGGASVNVSINLTPSGVENYRTVVAMLFQAINRIRQQGVAAWLYNEQAKIADIEFQFQEKSDPIHYVMGIANNLQYYPPAEAIRGPWLMDDFQPKLINEFLQYMRADNVVLQLTAAGVHTDKVSPWYNVAYSSRQLSADLQRDLRGLGVSEQIQIPTPNPFLPDDLQVLPIAKAQNVPDQLIAATGFDFWHKQYADLKVPKSNVYISIRSPESGISAKYAAMTELWVELLRDRLNEFAYPAQLAGLDFSIIKHHRGISVRVAGFSDKQQVLLEEILRQMRDDPKFDEQRFADIKGELVRKWYNRERSQPYLRLMSDLRQQVINPNYSETELMEAIQSVDSKSLQQFIHQYWLHTDVDMLVNGNIDASRATAMARQVQQMLVSSPPSDAGAIGVVRLAAGADFQRVVDVEHQDSAYICYVQAPGNSIKDQAITMLTGQIIETPFYQQLRTEQQLGYVVWGGYMPYLTVPGLVFAVQSPSAGVLQLDTAVTEFIQHGAEQFKSLTANEFAQHKKAVVHNLREKAKNLYEETERLWLEIAIQDLSFDRRERVAAAVEQISFAEWQNFYRQLLIQAPRSIRSFTAGDGKQPKLARDSIDDTGSFKNIQRYYEYP